MSGPQLHAIQRATFAYNYRGIPMIKNPYDFALYPMLLWNVKPATVIEIGSYAGGKSRSGWRICCRIMWLDSHVYLN